MQMPRGVPVATVAINNATNAGLLAVRMLGVSDPDLQARWALSLSLFSADFCTDLPLSHCPLSMYTALLGKRRQSRMLIGILRCVQNEPVPRRHKG